MKVFKFIEQSSGDFDIFYWLKFHVSNQYKALCQAHANNGHCKIITRLPEGVTIKADCTARWNVQKANYDAAYEMADRIDDAVDATIAEWQRIRVLAALAY